MKKKQTTKLSLNKRAIGYLTQSANYRIVGGESTVDCTSNNTRCTCVSCFETCKDTRSAHITCKPDTAPTTGTTKTG